MTTIAAVIYSLLALMLVLFQIAMAMGAPWGHLAMGGRWPGRFPVAMRVVAALQAGLIAAFAWVVLAHAGVVAQHALADRVIWVVLAFAVLGAVMNLISPSRDERKLWFPVALAMLVSVVFVIFA